MGKSKRKQKDDLDIHGKKEKKLPAMYVCKICNKDFKSVKKFIEHSISSHSNNTKAGGSQDEKQYEKTNEKTNEKPDEKQDENQDEKQDENQDEKQDEDQDGKQDEKQD